MAEEVKQRGRSPDYKVSVMDKTTGESSRVGCGWANMEEG